MEERGEGAVSTTLWRCVLALAMCLLLSVILGSSTSSGASQPVIVVNFDAPVDPGSSSLMASAVAAAVAERSPAIVIEMNTPGGYLSDMTAIISTIEKANQSGIPTYTYVPPDALAASAGSYIAMASNKILMGPGSEIGPSTPIVEGGTPLQQNHTEDAMISLMVSLADKWGRNATAAQAMVVSDLAFSSSDAIKYHIADGNATSLQGALQTLGLQPSYTVVQEGTYDQLLGALSDPNLSGILIFLGAIALILDLTHPTVVLSVAGALALVAGLVGIEVLGASSLGALVVFIGIALMFLELKLGHGFAMIGGAIVSGAGVVLLFQGLQYSSSTLVDYSQVEAVAVVAVGVLAGLYLRWVMVPLRNKRRMTGPESLVGKRGAAISPTEVRVEGVVWRARSLTGELSQGTNVTVRGVEGLVLAVEPDANR